MRSSAYTLIHAGLPPQWDLATAATAAHEVEQALAIDPVSMYEHMYGDEPDCWSDSLAGYERLRFAVNCLTRLRYCDARGRINLRLNKSPEEVDEPWLPWFRAPQRRSRELRIVCGHWSTLGVYLKDNVSGIDAGCVWGGNLCALRLDEPDEPILIGCGRHQQPGGDRTLTPALFYNLRSCSNSGITSAARSAPRVRAAGSTCTNRPWDGCTRARHSPTRAMWRRRSRRRSRRSRAGASLPAADRAAWLNRLADLIERDLDLFARAESQDTGKPLALARTLDIPRAIANFRFFAAAATQFASEAHVMEIGALNYTLRQPHRRRGGISPWNLPLYLFTWKIAPALASRQLRGRQAAARSRR